VLIILGVNIITLEIMNTTGIPIMAVITDI
jgi:hypothetical protein